MQNLQDIEEKIFFECKSILDSLSKINSKDELLQKQDLCYELSERIAFLKILEKNESAFVQERKPIDFFDNHDSDFRNVDENYVNDDIIEEEVIFNNELNEIDSPQDDFEAKIVEEKPHIEPIIEEKPEIIEGENVEELPLAEAYIEDIVKEETEVPLVENFAVEDVKTEDDSKIEEESIEGEIEEKHESVTPEEPKKVIVKEDFEEILPSEKDDNWFEDKSEDAHDRKFKLANIKGLKNVHSLFDDEQLRSLEEPLVASNSHVATNYMEAEKSTREFRLDLNDKLTFTKMLFGGSQYELNETVTALNQFKNIEQAKEYLSDLYYEKSWDKVDEYAQRLWTLVENKFI